MEIRHYLVFLACLLFLLSGCSKDEDTQEQLQGRFRNYISGTVIPPPAELNLNSYYSKYINSTGIAIIGSDSIDDIALKIADSIAQFMLIGLEDVQEQMISLSTYYAIMPDSSGISDIPELTYLADDSLTAIRTGCFHPRDGLGVSYEANFLCKPWPANQNAGEDVFVHEFAHAIHLNGFYYINKSFENRLKASYNDAIADGLWDSTYAATDYVEYFAEGMQTWFEVNYDLGPLGGDGVHNNINTRLELQQYDVELYNIIDQYFNDRYDVPGCN